MGWEVLEGRGMETLVLTAGLPQAVGQAGDCQRSGPPAAAGIVHI